MNGVPPIIPISDLRKDAAAVLQQVRDSGRPYVITQRGRAAAVMLSVEAYEQSERDHQLLLELVRGDREIAAGDGHGLDDVMAEADRMLEDEPSAGDRRREETPLPAPRYEKTIRVTLRDCDGMRHVNNAVYLTYIEIARTEYVFGLSGGRRLEDFDFILARAETDFRSEATLGDELIVELWPVRVGTRSWELRYRIRQADSGRVVLESTSVLVSYDFSEGRTIPVPQPFRARLEAEISACGASPESG